MTDPLENIKPDNQSAAPSGFLVFSFWSGIAPSGAKRQRFLAGPEILPASFSFIPQVWRLFFCPSMHQLVTTSPVGHFNQWVTFRTTL